MNNALRRPSGSTAFYLFLRELVLFMEYTLKRPEAQLLDVAQLPMPVEVVLGVPACGAHPPRHAPQQLYEQRQVVLIPAACIS